MQNALGLQGQSGVRWTEGSTSASVQTRKASAWRRWQALRYRRMSNWAVFKVADKWMPCGHQTPSCCLHSCLGHIHKKINKHVLSARMTLIHVLWKAQSCSYDTSRDQTRDTAYLNCFWHTRKKQAIDGCLFCPCGLGTTSAFRGCMVFIQKR